ncbi:MAG TPA: GNAT family N-acetyltransferase [Ignavibacteriaceae bacterium]|nr:GNAT family N-acetyltransferase [Ignavibacteriaceae bacterium]
MTITQPQTPEEFEKYYDLRWRILRAPWDQPKGSEKDEKENDAIHVMVCESDRIPVGIGRAHFNNNNEAQIRYMAVEENQQGKGIGAAVLNELEMRSKKKGAKFIILNARENAVKFYEKHGYKIIKRSHTLFGSIPHFEMKKDL